MTVSGAHFGRLCVLSSGRTSTCQQRKAVGHSVMTMNQKPQPLYPSRNRKHCPVCEKVSYSAAGIHPQCAMDQADAKRIQEVKPLSKSPKKTLTKDADAKPWQKTCPNCKEFMHIRKKLCDCGYAFSGMGGR